MGIFTVVLPFNPNITVHKVTVKHGNVTLQPVITRSQQLPTIQVMSPAPEYQYQHADSDRLDTHGR